MNRERPRREDRDRGEGDENADRFQDGRSLRAKSSEHGRSPLTGPFRIITTRSGPCSIERAPYDSLSERRPRLPAL
jgi:hypothetical protein